MKFGPYQSNKNVSEDRNLTRRTVIISGLALSCTACASVENLIGVETKRRLTEGEIRQRGHRIYIATTRRPSDKPEEFFSNKRNQTISFAAVDVVVPPSHEPGNVERPVSLPPDPEKHFVITKPVTFETQNAFKTEIDAVFNSMPRGQRDGLLWIHGYNTNLTDAVLRLAQFVEDSGYNGVPMLYTWASHGSLTGYVYDINSALLARDFLEEVPKLLADGSLEGLDLVAHSMGNFLTMEAIRGVSNRGLFNTSGKLRNVILAAPDIDRDLFFAQLRRIPEKDRRFFVLTSSDDRALQLSEFIARGRRVGQLRADELENTGLDVIDLSQVHDTSSVNHTKFVDAPEIVQLLGNRILAGDSYSNASERSFGRSIIVGAGGAIYAIDELS